MTDPAVSDDPTASEDRSISGPLTAPFPWTGGKAKCAPQVWDAFGDVQNYVEPFAGSLAVLLGRPAGHRPMMETANDRDRLIVNFFRAATFAPDDVAKWADWPVTEADLTARHVWLLQHGVPALERLDADPEFFDARIAGWWVWGISAWLGPGWCTGEGPWVSDGEKLVTKPDPAVPGVNKKRPHLMHAGKGVHNLTNREQIDVVMRRLQTRLRFVRFTNRDWTDVVTPAVLSEGSTVGVFLDPPYDPTFRKPGLYAHETDVVSTEVRDWALSVGNDPRMRIALCGYEDEHGPHMPSTWRCVTWSAGAGFKTYNGDTTGNRHEERIWFSPRCDNPNPTLF